MFDYRRACFLNFIMNPVPLIYNYILNEGPQNESIHLEPVLNTGGV